MIALPDKFPAEKFQKIISLLDSDKDGEVLSAVRTSTAILEKFGLRWSEVGELITKPAEKIYVQVEPERNPFDEPEAKPKRKKKSRPIWKDIAEYISQSDEFVFLNESCQEFIESILEYPASRSLSAKQAKFLRSIEKQITEHEEESIPF